MKNEEFKAEYEILTINNKDRRIFERFEFGSSVFRNYFVFYSKTHQHYRHFILST